MIPPWNLQNAMLSVGGLGYFPKMPGTIGTLFALLIFLLPKDFISVISLILIITLTFISMPLIKRTEEKYGQDPSFIVVDEVIGFLTITSLPFIQWNVLNIILAFVFFRIFDILKPYPINKINNKNSAWCVILDDIVAGIYSIILLYILHYIITIF